MAFHEWRWAVEKFRNTSYVFHSSLLRDDSAECRFLVTIALAIRMATLHFPR